MFSILEKKSKRVTAKKRYKIEKKVREHNRKIKRADKLKKKGKKGRKLIIVPGDCPFKEQILSEATFLKDSILKEKLLKKEQIKEIRRTKKEQIAAQKKLNPPGPHNVPVVKHLKAKDVPTSDEAGAGSGQQKDKPQTTFQDLLKKATERGYHFEEIEKRKVAVTADPSLKAFYREFQTVTILYFITLSQLCLTKAHYIRIYFCLMNPK